MNQNYSSEVEGRQMAAVFSVIVSMSLKYSGFAVINNE